MKFLALLPCDRVLFDKNGTLSLITILERIELALQVPEGSEITLLKNLPAPRDWFIYTRWEASPEDVGKSFNQVFQVLWPTGESFMQHVAALATVKENDLIQQSTVRMMAFPAGHNGAVKIVTWLEFDGKQVSDKFDCYITVASLTGAEATAALEKLMKQ